MPPFMSYVAYSTYNYRFADPSIGTTKYDNLRLVRAFERGAFAPPIDSTFPLAEVPAAFARLDEAERMGKIVISIAEPQEAA